MNFFKKITFIIFILSIFFAHQSFAVSNPSFDTLTAASITDNSAFLYGMFNSNDNNYFPTDQPFVWFEYGADKDNLNKKTPLIAKVKGAYIVSQKITNLEEETRYWYRAVISFDSHIDYGDINSFVTLKKELVNLADNNEESKNETNFLSPEELLQQYNRGLEDKSINNEIEKDAGVVISNKEPLSFFDFFRYTLWGKEKNEQKDTLIVHPKEEIQETAEQRKARLEKLSEQKNYNNSAANDDERGEIVEYNTNYRNSYQKNNYTSPSNKINYFTVFLIIIFLGIGITLTYFFLKRKKDIGNTIKRNYERKAQQASLQQQGRYHIPVRRDLDPSTQNNDRRESSETK